MKNNYLFVKMVRKSFQTIEIAYSQIRQSACGRQSCTVMIMVAYEVMLLILILLYIYSEVVTDFALFLMYFLIGII